MTEVGGASGSCLRTDQTWRQASQRSWQTMASLLESSSKRPGSLHFGQRRTGMERGNAGSYIKCNDDVNKLDRHVVFRLTSPDMLVGISIA